MKGGAIAAELQVRVLAEPVPGATVDAGDAGHGADAKAVAERAEQEAEQPQDEQAKKAKWL